MKKLSTVVMICLLVFGIGFVRASEQDAISNLANALKAMMTALAEELGKQGVKEQITLNAQDALVWWKAPQSSVTIQRMLYANNVYLFALSGDNDVTDVELTVTSAGGQKMTSDTAVSRDGYALFVAPLTGNYTIQAKLISSVSGGAAHIAYAYGYITAQK